VQAVTSARFIGPAPAGAVEPIPPVDSEARERAEAARPGTRLVGIYLDEYHVDAASSARVRAAVAAFVEQMLSPRDLVAVMRPLDPLLSIRLTRDRDQIARAIEAFEGRKGDYTPRTRSERDVLAGTPARIEQMRAQVTTSALSALANHLGGLNPDLRKILIVVSEALPRPDRRRGLEGLPTAETIERAASRSNVAIYVVDPRGAAAPGDDRSVLHGLAAATGGVSIANAADLSDAMRAIAADASAYYIVAYETVQPADGRFHAVEVAVRRPGITVRARKGYWAPTLDDAVRGTLLQPRPRVQLGPPTHISRFIRPWFGAGRGADGKTRVTFVWEPAQAPPGPQAARPARVALEALAADGTVVYEGMVAPTGPLRPAAPPGAEARAEFDVPPGPLRLRMSIEDAGRRPIDSDVREISVRDLSAVVALGTPQVFRGRTALDFRSAAAADPSPVASREFSRAERLLIRVPAYGPPSAPLTVTARLLNRRGQVIRALAVRPGPAPGLRDIDLPLAPFAPGEYRLGLEASSGSMSAADSLDFRITN
jgi:VWFA-related protein